MDPNLITLIIGLAGIIATLISSILGFYFIARARSAPLRELLYSKQVEIITQLISKQARFRVFATLLVGDDPAYKDRARLDIGICVKNYSILTEKAAAILSTELWIDLRRLSNYMTELVVLYDENHKLDKEHIAKLSALDAKVLLISRAVLGVDELTQESLELFSSGKKYEGLVNIEAEELKTIVVEECD
jgi:hypothetical protein